MKMRLDFASKDKKDDDDDDDGYAMNLFSAQIIIHVHTTIYYLDRLEKEGRSGFGSNSTHFIDAWSRIMNIFQMLV